jgi:hypothetical protein
MNNIPEIKLLDRNFLEGRTFFSGKIVNPKRDWSILVFLFSIIIIASIGFDFYMYRKIVSGDMYVSVRKDELVIESLKSNDLKKIADNFELKKTNMTNLKLENLIDPSI